VIHDEPVLTSCDLCQAKAAALPGPRWRRGRPEPPAGYRVGYLVEVGVERTYVICAPCLADVLQIAA
jgi:hypothetical protein